jgi:hypothetical protein
MVVLYKYLSLLKHDTYCDIFTVVLFVAAVNLSERKRQCNTTKYSNKNWLILLQNFSFFERLE